MHREYSMKHHDARPGVATWMPNGLHEINLNAAPARWDGMTNIQQSDIKPDIMIRPFVLFGTIRQEVLMAARVETQQKTGRKNTGGH